MRQALQRYREFVRQDRMANERALPLDKPYILRFLKLLRQEELLLTEALLPWGLQHLLLRWIARRRHRLGLLLGFSIPPNVFGPGVSLPHVGPIVVNERAVIGARCRIHVGVNIGAYAGGSPTLGQNVYLGPGAKLYGPILIADDIRVGTNAVVNRSYHEPGITIAGVPARKVSHRGHSSLGRVSDQRTGGEA